ncbi:hypothetical protein GCM10025874_01770 [Arenivirga flava]|uniref:Uncharacterized protein n=1 Tax=Arenivirga flava TaxID=1930060 RepID=A0AA37X7Z8_9MICO|nr:hypothetical protein GCM10025874_01770 [Arenivirga flava]
MLEFAVPRPRPEMLEFAVPRPRPEMLEPAVPQPRPEMKVILATHRQLGLPVRRVARISFILVRGWCGVGAGRDGQAVGRP